MNFLVLGTPSCFLEIMLEFGNWRDEEKDWKKYPFIWLNEQEGEYFTCHCCIRQEELEMRRERQNIQDQVEDV